jgi:hypothetical protein
MISFAEAPISEVPSAVSLVNTLLRVMDRARAKFRKEFGIPEDTPVFCILDTPKKQAECWWGEHERTYDFTDLV